MESFNCASPFAIKLEVPMPGKHVPGACKKCLILGLSYTPLETCALTANKGLLMWNQQGCSQSHLADQVQPREPGTAPSMHFVARTTPEELKKVASDFLAQRNLRGFDLCFDSLQGDYFHCGECVKSLDSRCTPMALESTQSSKSMFSL